MTITTDQHDQEGSRPVLSGFLLGAVAYWAFRLGATLAAKGVDVVAVGAWEDGYRDGHRSGRAEKADQVSKALDGLGVLATPVTFGVKAAGK